MSLLRRKKKKPRNIAQHVPLPLVEHEVGDDGAVHLLVPRFRSRWMQWFQSRLKRPDIKVKLDEIGSATWLLIDGRRTVMEIGGEMEERFGERIQPTGERLGLFLTTLRRNDFIELKEPSAAPEQISPK